MPRNGRETSAAKVEPPSIESIIAAPIEQHPSTMACPRCALRLSRISQQTHTAKSSCRAFHTSPSHQRLGAFTAPQEWTNLTYSFNKATTRTLPVAIKHADDLITGWATQQKRSMAPDNPLYKQLLRNRITAQRRKTDRIFFSKPTTKDFGDRIELNAFVYDGITAAEKEEERKRKARMGQKTEGGEGAKRRAPRRAPPRRIGQGPGTAGLGRPGGAAAGRGPQTRAPGFRRLGGGASGGAAGGAARGPPRS